MPIRKKSLDSNYSDLQQEPLVQSEQRSRQRVNFIDEHNIKSVRITQKDYQPHSTKKGKYDITVPKPFSFDNRDKFRSKSIREQKLDLMISEKEIQENNLIKYHIRSKPVPANVLVPRYEAI